MDITSTVAAIIIAGQLNCSPKLDAPVMVRTDHGALLTLQVNTVRSECFGGSGIDDPAFAPFGETHESAGDGEFGRDTE